MTPIAHLGHFISAFMRGLAQPCVLCADEGGADGLCDGCRHDLPRLPASRCPVCALPLATPAVCGRCLRHPPTHDAVVAAFRYGFPVDGMIRRLKFQGALPLAEMLAGELLAVVRAQPQPDFLLPVPLALARMRHRGFNQSAEIARPLARALGLRIGFDVLHRVRDTPEQSGLTLAARRANLRGAFRCSSGLAGAHVAIVDDVMTSGATLDEVARTLKQAGALRVVGWVVARTAAPAANRTTAPAMARGAQISG